MKYMKIWLAALLPVLCVFLFVPAAYAANDDGFLDFYEAYGTTYEKEHENTHFAIDTTWPLKYPIPEAFRFEFVSINDIELSGFMEKPIYIDAKLGEVTTKQIKFNFDEDGEKKQININLSVNPITRIYNYDDGYEIHFAYNGQMTTQNGSYPINFMESSFKTGGYFDEGYPYFMLRGGSTHSVKLNLVAIVPGNKMTNQIYWKYSGETVYTQRTKEYGIELESMIYPAYKTKYIVEYDKENDVLRKRGEVTGLREGLFPEEDLFAAVGDKWEFEISSGINNAPDTLFYGDILKIKSRAAVVRWDKFEYLKTHGQGNLDDFWPLTMRISLGTTLGEDDFKSSDTKDDNDNIIKEGQSANELRTGRSVMFPEFITQEVDMVAELNINNMRKYEGLTFNDKATLPISVYYGDYLTVERIYTMFVPVSHEAGITMPEPPDDIVADHDDAPKSGGHQSVDTRADSDAGETGVGIPAAIVTAIIGSVAALAGAGAGSGGGNDDNKKKNRYEMRLQKDFGDTILIGEQVAVFARIVEITPEGAESSRSDLTAQISISSPHYLIASGEGMSGEYKAAYIDAPETAGDIPTEAIVSFRFAGRDGSFTNNVTFQIGEQKIVFGQENLTLPAGYDKTERLPFAVLGMGKDAAVTASIIREDGYSIEVEAGEEENLYYALITEKNKAEGEAGDYDSYTLEIKATNGERTITGELPLYRFHMGLRLDVGSLGCYVEEYDPANHQSTAFMFTANEKKYVPAETKATLTLYDWDIENHKIFQVAPVITDFEIQALQNEDQPMLEKLGVQCEVLEGEPGGSRSLLFRCCQGALDAPNRFKVNLTLAVTRDGEEEKVTLKKEVLLRSQPLREHKSTEAAMAAIKEDSHLTERLEHIRGAICAQGYLNNLFPLVKIIDVMLSGYDEAYGYDAYQLEKVQQIWEGFLVGDIKGANTEPETFTIMGELWSVLTDQAVDLYEKASAFEQSLSFMERLALGAVTFGKSEVAFTAIAGIRTTKEYIEQGGDSALEAFRLGAKSVTVDYLIFRGSEKALGTALKSKAAASVGKSVKTAAIKSVESVKRFSSAVTGRTTKAAISNSINAKNLAAAKAGKLVESGKRGLGKSAEQLELDKALRAGREFGKEQVDNLRAAEWQFRLNPTDANRKLLDNLTLKVQQNKLAMYQLQDYADEGLNATRKAFNETLASFYSKADTLAKSELSAATGVPVNQIKIVNASASSQPMLRSGKRTTMDRDWTAYYVDSKGQTVYFDQITTEQIYNKSFYKAATGAESADLKIANRFAKKTDQTVIQDILGHKESYATDLPKVLDTGLHGTALNNPKKLASSVVYKGKERFAECDRLLKLADSITDLADRELARAHALGERMEGYRQLVKQFDNFIRPRDVARRVGAEISKISEKTHVAVELCRKQLATNSTMSISDLENGLRSLGFTAESFADALGDAVIQIG